MAKQQQKNRLSHTARELEAFEAIRQKFLFRAAAAQNSQEYAAAQNRLRRLEAFRPRPILAPIQRPKIRKGAFLV